MSGFLHGGFRKTLSLLLCTAMVVTGAGVDSLAAYAEETVDETMEVVSEANDIEEYGSEDNLTATDYSQGFSLWFNTDGATGIAAGQQGDHPVYAGEEMAAKTNSITVDGTVYYSVQGNNNPKTDGSNPNGAIPNSGSYLKVVAPADGTLTVYGFEAPKTFYITKGSTAYAQYDTAFGTATHSYTIEVVSGEEWYFYAQGSKAQFIGVVFEKPKADVVVPITWNGADLGDATVTFTNVSTKSAVTVGASDTSVTLKEGYKYSLSIDSANLMIENTELDLTASGVTGVTISILTVSPHRVYGSFKGLPEGASVSELIFTDEAGVANTATINGTEYEASLKNGSYTASATITGAEGYTVYDHVFVEGENSEEIGNEVWFYAPVKTYSSEYKETLKVGTADGADYATISEAMLAIKAMTRTQDQYVTVVLTDEEYVEQVIVDSANVKLTAAEGVTPTIRWYYGIGYKYYSIDSTGYYNLKNANDKFEMNYAQRWGSVVRVKGAGFIAEGIDFVNTFNLYVCEEELGDSKVGSSSEYGQSISGSLQERTSTTLDVANGTNVERAAAVALDAANAEFYGCSFTSSQDTLYTGSANAYFNNCVITGQTDYIFGNEGCKAIFDNCELKWLGYTAGSKAGYITATRGSYLFRGCKVTMNTKEGYTVTPGYFGRPWSNKAEVAFVGTAVAEGAVTEDGWTAMNKVNPSDVVFREYGNCTGTELSSDSSKFFKTTFAQAEGNEFALTKAEGEKLADPANDGDYLGNWTPVHHSTEVLDLSAVSEWNSATEAEVPGSGEGVIGVDIPGTIKNTYVFEAKDMTTFAASNDNKGKTASAGTNGYFTLQYSEKTKIDTSSKTWEDGYTSGVRLNFGKVATTDDNSIKFTTTYDDVIVKVWWAQGGDDNRQITILNSAGTAVATTTGTYTKNSPYYSELTLDKAGTYFLGNAVNNNYIFKVEVTESITYVLENKTFTLDATNDLTALAAASSNAGTVIKAGTDNYFSLLLSAKSKIDPSSKSFSDGYAATQRFNPGGKAETTQNSVKVTTTSKNAAVKVWWAEGGDDNRQIIILDSKGKAVATTTGTCTKNSPYVSELTIPEAGTYYIGGDINNNYIFKIVVTEKILTTGKEEAPERKSWSEVSAPVITAVSQTEGTNNIVVSVSGVIGFDGADMVTVTMNDVSGNEVASARSSKEGESVDLTLTGKATGLYTFKAEASREEETDTKASAATDAKYFVLALAAPAVGSVTNKGEGVVTVTWDSVQEATGYIITVNGTEQGTVYDKDTLSADISENLEIGTKYTFGVKAVRERTNPVTNEKVTDKSSIGMTVKATVVENAQRPWGFTVYGTSTNTANNGYTGSVYEDDKSVTVYSENGKGKIVPNSTDGLAYYYTKIDPEKENFTLEARVTVDKWTFSNGQEGFGLMVADTIGKNGSTDTVWNNSYMAMASKVEYYYDVYTQSVKDVADGNEKITMKLGLGVLARDGVTAKDASDFAKEGTFYKADGSKSGTPENFKTQTTPLETSCGHLGSGSYNIIGAYTNDPGGSQDNTLTTFIFSIRRNNDGYLIQYKDASGNVLSEKLIYDQERTALTQIDPSNIYVGFFASRNARITVSDISLTTIAPEDDDPMTVRPIEYVTPSYTVESASNANTENYDLVYYGNADVKVSIVDDHDNLICSNASVKAFTKGHFKTVIPVGKTTFTVTVTPDPDYVPGDHQLLSSYEAKTLTHTVTRSGFAGTNLYVSPAGSSKGYGTKDNPLDIYTAVKYAEPGQKILLTEGTYNLSKTVKIERGINGTEGNYIYLMADPEAATRPVLDFNGKCAGMILAGDHWYFKGFDVTRSSNGQKGIQLSGSCNVLEDLKTYRNGNTGIQISRYKSSDLFEDWPSDNLVLNCTSFLNADAGYEDADGFAAKLTVGNGNVFDGCISAFNADDGWDLYAKVETGSIGAVTIKNSAAFMNGYVLDAQGNKVNAGNGNGFKMGGESLSGKHTLINSIAFANKAKGIDSNSCPDIIAISSTSFNNESYNVAFYTNNAVNTAFVANKVLSYKDSKGNTIGEQIKEKGTQTKSDICNESSFLFDGTKSVNSAAVPVSDSWFVSLDTDSVIEAFKNYINTGVYETAGGAGITRNADGSLNFNGYLQLTESGKAFGAGAALGTSEGTASEVSLYEVNVSTVLSEKVLAAVSEENATLASVRSDLQAELWKSEEFKSISIDAGLDNIAFYEVNVRVLNNGVWEDATAENFKGRAVDAILPLPAGTDSTNFGFAYRMLPFYATQAGTQTNGIPSVNGAGLSVKVSSNAIVAVAFQDMRAAEEDESDWGDVIAEDRALFESPADIVSGKLWLAGIKDVDYTGEAVKFNIRVYNGKHLLVAGTDYTVSYKNNKNAYTLTAGEEGFSSSKAPSIIIKAKGNYEGSVTKYFKINPINIGANSTYASQFRAENVILSETSSVQKAKVVLARNGKALTLNRDYVLSYEDSAEGAYKAAGTYNITIKGIGNYTGTLTATETIVKATLISKAKISSIAKQKYTGNAVAPAFTVKYNNKTLKGVYDSGEPVTEDISYVYSFTNNTEIGTATLTVTGVNGFAGTVTKTFKIYGTALAAKNLKNFKSSLAYTGKPVVQPEANFKYGNNVLVGVSADEFEAMDEAAAKNVSYTYSYDNNVEIGIATVIYTGVNAYSGTVKKTFKITGTSIKRAAVTGFESKVLYNGKRITFDSIKVVNAGTELAEGRDYTVSYKNNVKAGKATLTVTGIGAYTGSVSKNFSITKYDLNTDELSRVNVTVGNASYSAKGAHPEVKVEYTVDGVATTLKEGVDYKLSFINNRKFAADLSTVTAKPTAVITGLRNFNGTRKKDNFTIGKFDIAQSLASATDVVFEYEIANFLTTDFTVVENAFAGYDKKGEPVYTTAKLIPGTDYIITNLKNVNTGRNLKVTDIVSAGTTIEAYIVGRGNYTGTTAVTYRMTAFSVNKAKISLKTALSFTGDEQSITKDMLNVKVGDFVLSEDSYEVESVIFDASMKKVTVTIVGAGRYGGRASVKISLKKKLFDF